MRPSPNALVPEHILFFGLYGSGKTHCWATWAEMQRQDSTPGHFYVIGTEWGSMGRLWEAYPDMGSNASFTDVQDWYELDEATSAILEKVANPTEGYRDVIVLEGGDKPWHWVQMLYDKLHGDAPQYMPKDPFSMEKGQTEVERDWVKINGVYRNWINSLLRSQAHLVVCCPQDELRLPNPEKPKQWHDDRNVLEQYSRHGFRPAGQKELGHHLHTVLWLKNPGYKRWTMTTVDDHTREQLDNEPITNFVMDYLVKVGKWEI